MVESDNSRRTCFHPRNPFDGSPFQLKKCTKEREKMKKFIFIHISQEQYQTIARWVEGHTKEEEIYEFNAQYHSETWEDFSYSYFLLFRKAPLAKYFCLLFCCIKKYFFTSNLIYSRVSFHHIISLFLSKNKIYRSQKIWVDNCCLERISRIFARRASKSRWHLRSGERFEICKV